MFDEGADQHVLEKSCAEAGVPARLVSVHLKRIAWANSAPSTLQR